MSSTHLRLVEALSPTQTSDILIGERSFPADSLLEDEMGLRWFLIESPVRVITTHLWSRAVTAGAAAIVTPHRGIWLAITTERFMDLREEVVGGFYLSQAASNWRPFESFPSYTGLLNLPDPTKGTGSPEPSDGLDEVDEIGFVNLHNHSEFSALDGMSKAREIVEIVVEQGGKYAAICDHGNCAGHPDLQAACDEAGLKPVFAMEGYLVDDRLRRKDDFTEPAPPKSDAESYEAWKARYDDFMARLRDYWHITLIATDQTGLRNLWAMSTESYRTGLYGNNARLDWEVLAQHSEGVICATGCLRGPLLHKGILDGDEQAALARLARLREIFDDRLYVEIHANTLPEQLKANRALADIAREQGLPLVAMVDSHYPRKSDYDAHRVWLSVQIKKDVDNEDSDLFGGHQDYHMMSEAEVRESLSYLPDDVVEESIRNTAVIASRATAEVRGTPTPPVYSKGGVEEDEERLLELCLSNWEKTRNKTKSQDEYIARFEREFNLLKKKSFCFTSGTMITMADGTVAPVEKIVPGDLVVTRAGIAPVGRVADRIAQETVRIKIAGGAWPLHTTPDHPFMTPTGWVEAGHLRKGDQVALEQAVAHSGATYDLLAAAQAVGWDTRREGERFARFGPGRWGPRQRKGWCPVAIDLDDDWAYLIGLWVAQGHREVLGTNEGQVSWTLHRNSSSVDRLQQTIRRLGLGEPRLYSKASACQPDHQGVTIKITNHPLWLLLGTLIGDGSKTKMLHPWLVNHPRARLVVDGWFAGDGTVSNSSGQHIVDTANEVLARQGRQIMLRSGEWATTTKFDTPDGEHYRFSWTPNRVKKPYGARWDGQRWWANVVSTERSGEAQVFNLTVAGDPSYVAEDVLVHNCGYFLMTADMTNFARSNGILVGPGRGSGGGSLVAYLSSITDIDPVESDLLFERFMTEGRTELPDFDVDYPASKKQVMQKYVRDRYGEDSTTVVGSVMRLKSKGIIDKLGKAMKDKLPEQFYIDQKAISAIIEDAEADTAGLGLSWKDLQIRAEEELRPYRETYPELFEMAGRLVGRVNTFGQHAAGMVITTDSALTDALPLRRAKEGGHMIAQFDKDVLEQLGFIKFDLLTLTNLDRVQETVDLIREQRGHQVDVYSWRDEYEDPQVWDEIAEAHTLGIFQIETTLGTQYAQRIKPKKLSDLADLVTIVRPGPRNSGLTESYIKRRDGDEEISYPDPRLETVLAKSFGSILYQEDIMQTCCHPSTAILTQDRGMVPISRLVVGDRVMTHLGRWRPVTEVMKRPLRPSERVIEINPIGYPRPLVVTEEHPIFAAEYVHRSGKKYRGADWVAAGDIRPTGGYRSHALVVPRLQDGSEVLSLFDLVTPSSEWGGFSAMVQGGMIEFSHAKVQALPSEVKYTAALGRLLGLYLAEGSRSRGKLKFSFHVDETHLHQVVVNDMREVFGVEAKIVAGTTSNVSEVVVYHSGLERLFALCGSTAADKMVPAWGWGGGRDFREAVLWGWHQGDGSTIGHKHSGFTSSEALAQGMRLFAVAAEQSPSIQWRPAVSGRVIGGRALRVDSGSGYVLRWQDRYVYRKLRLEGCGMTAPVLSTTAIEYDEDYVWNLHVDEDESYLTHAGVVHNCMVLAGYDSNEADKVRKILGKKKVEQIGAAGQEFVERAVANGMHRENAAALWAQMAEFAKYCVTGDTVVHLASSGKSSDGTITAADLWRKINAPLLDPIKGRRAKDVPAYSGPCVVCGEDRPIKSRGACNACYVWRQKFQDVDRGLYGLVVQADGRVRPGRILMVHKHEPAQTWTITLADGRSITATGNHRHLTPDGLRRVDELTVGDSLMVMGDYEVHRYEDGEDRTTVGDRLLSGAINGSFGEENYGYIDGGFTSLMAWTAQAPDACEHCGHDGSKHRLERAHLDGNHANNAWGNLSMLCVSCHKRYDYQHNGRVRRWGKGRPTLPSEIVSIEPRAVEEVYSVVFDDPHVWVANGIATENSFNRAHAFAYAVLGYWNAWLKFHYPRESLTVALSLVDKDRIPEFVKETRRMGYQVLPPDVNLSGVGFRMIPGTLDIRYGLDSIKGMGEIAAQAIMDNQPYASYEDFMDRVVNPKGAKVNMGHVALLARVGALDTLVPNRRGLESVLKADKTGESSRCVFKQDTIPVGAPNGLPCGFDWDSEPVPINPRTGKKTKPKPIPKRCTKACRQYQAPPPPSVDDFEPYTDADIRDIEREMLGVFLSSTPFDGLPDDVREITLQQANLIAQHPSPDGDYVLAGIVTKRRPHKDRGGNPMGFVGVETERGTIDVTVFKGEWASYGHLFSVGSFVLMDIRKNSRGATLQALQVIE